MAELDVESRSPDSQSIVHSPYLFWRLTVGQQLGKEEGIMAIVTSAHVRERLRYARYCCFTLPIFHPMAGLLPFLAPAPISQSYSNSLVFPSSRFGTSESLLSILPFLLSPSRWSSSGPPHHSPGLLQQPPKKSPLTHPVKQPTSIRVVSLRA